MELSASELMSQRDWSAHPYSASLPTEICCKDLKLGFLFC